MSAPAADAGARQAGAALEIVRGVGRLLRAHGLAAINEVALANGRRADVVGITQRGEIWIVEVKSSLADYRADQKWPEYHEFCDRLFFAVPPAFPLDILPMKAGLIVADRFGGEIVRNAPDHRLAAARRKAMTLRLARTAAFRLHDTIDPFGPKARGAEAHSRRQTRQRRLRRLARTA
jgi:hypothetical protein